MAKKNFTMEEKRRIAEEINLLAGEEAIYTVDNELTLIISSNHEYVRKKDMEKLGEYKSYIRKACIDDNVKWIECGTFDGFEDLAELDATDRLLANISIEGVFEGTNLDIHRMKIKNGGNREQKQLKWKSAHKNTYGRRLSPPAHI